MRRCLAGWPCAERSCPASPGSCRHAGADPALWRKPASGGGVLHRRHAREGVATAQAWQGKELSYNNINDTDAAFELVAEFDPADGPAVAIIKHANPCGVATGGDCLTAYQRGLSVRPTSAFGGIIALNQPLDAATAEEISGIFTEVVIAPGATDDASGLCGQKEPAAADNRRLAGCHRRRARLAAGFRRISGAGS